MRHMGDGPGSAEAVIHDHVVYLPVITAPVYTPSVTGQTQQVLDAIDARLAAAGTSKNRMLSVTVFVSDARFLDEMHALWDQWVPWHDPPVCTELVAKLAPEGAKVGVQVIAAE
ncbi:Rid family hydrolase [Acuticoccus sediminis]|uniref:Rid family hydrolase n=1 Tax=Acuticoccus sediminis TaxID=2184697 RepID=UPI001CFF4DE4|nr:Rid family hydrolase [Acuticoccus sediminis]